MRRFASAMRVVSTAGHVDHGKSTLIERLSGIDPDRLAEEKARGLTTDLVDNITLSSRARQIKARLAGTTLARSEVVAVSAAKGLGIGELLGAIDRMLARAGEPRDRGRPRVFLDRAFSVKGAGTIVTG